jgi:transmembrane protein DUF3566
MVIERVEPLSCAKIAGVLYAMLGLVFGALFSLLSLFGAFASAALASDAASRPPAFVTLFGVGAVVLFPIFYGAMGFIFTLIGALLYNVAAKAVGGIEIHVRETSAGPATPLP